MTTKVLFAIAIALSSAFVSSAVAQTTYCASGAYTVTPGTQCFATLAEAEAFLRAEPVPPIGNAYLERLSETVIAQNYRSLQYGVRKKTFESLIGDWYFAWNYGGSTVNCGARVPVSIVQYGCADEPTLITELLQHNPYQGLTSGGTTGEYGPWPPTRWDDAGINTATNQFALFYANPQQRILTILAANGSVYGYEPLNRTDYFNCPLPFRVANMSETSWPLVCRLLNTGTITVTSSQFCSGTVVGNPCVAGTGNKELREVDFQWEGKPFRRAYNSIRDLPFLSGLSDSWAHSFSDRLSLVTISTTGELNWIRSDGYLEVMVFVQPGLYRSRIDAGTQLIRESDAAAASAGRWRLALADGRVLWFSDAGRLLRIAERDRTLTLSYCSPSQMAAGTCYSTESLVSVVSSTGRRLDLDYGIVPVVLGPIPTSSIAMPLLTQIRAEGHAVASYTYDGLGRLVNAKSGDLTATLGRQYLYAEAPNLCRDGAGNPIGGCSVANFPHHLTGVVDELGVRWGNYTYDQLGRATSSEHAGAAGRVALSYLPDGSAQAALAEGATKAFQFAAGTFRKPSSIQYKDGGGAVLSSVARTYAEDLVLSDDANGNRTCYVYGAGRNLEFSRIEGLTTATPCNAVTPPEAPLPAGSRKINSQWHPEFPLLVRQSGPSRITTWVFNGQPDPFAANALAACAPPAAALPNGQPRPALCKTVVQGTSDLDGSTGFTVAIPSLQQADPFADRVMLALQMDGAHGATTFIDTSAFGRVPASVVAPVALDTANARNGSAAASFTGGYLHYASSPDFDMGSGDFTVEAWLKFSAASAGQRAYVLGKADAIGANSTFAIGKSTANLLIASAATTGGSVSLSDTSAVIPNQWYHVALERVGNTLTLWRNGIPAASATITGSFAVNGNKFGIGVLGEYIGAYGGAYGTRMMGWIDDFRLTKGVARMALQAPAIAIDGVRITAHAYDAAGRLQSTDGPRTDVLDLSTYTYYADTAFSGPGPDAEGHTVGDLATAVDALGRTTRYTKYNLAGQVLETIDPNNVTSRLTYDAGQRLRTSTVGTETTQYEYYPSGRLKKLTLPGGTAFLQYEYDGAQRLTTVTDQLGNKIAYTLDAAGNRTAEKTQDPTGALRRQLTRVPDALGRIQQLTGRE